MPPSMPLIFFAGDFFDLAEGVVAGGEDEVLEHFGVTGSFGVNFDTEDVLVAIHLDVHHAATSGTFDADGGDLGLHALLHLLRLLHHSLHVSGHFHWI